MVAVVLGHRVRAVFVSAAMLVVVGCSASHDEGAGRSAASCARQVTYENRTYGDVAHTPITVGKSLGAVTFTSCDDTGRRAASDEVPVKSTAYRVEGLAEDVAVAVGDTADEAELFAVRTGEGLPPEVKDLLDAR
ncbi:DUF6281 family protein [Streptomyces sp. NPDC020607]|uniref:DUF6281 family protein n=1 Tax=Streptomyces sp. NPDC020607 TaxID=3365082 RepID=UPI00379483FB